MNFIDRLEKALSVKIDRQHSYLGYGLSRAEFNHIEGDRIYLYKAEKPFGSLKVKLELQ